MDITALLDRGFAVTGYEDLPVDDTAGGVAFTTGTVGNATVAIFTLDTAPIRMRLTGAPTTSSGEQINVGDPPRVIWGSANIAAARFIRTGSTSGTIRVHFLTPTG